jgi:squalene-hopene/tetraprenyl-beta-curcumene cyclase
MAPYLPDQAGPAADPLDDTIARAAAALAAAQREDGHWVFELEADATIPAEYVLLRHYLGEPVDEVLEAKIGRYLRRIQSAPEEAGGHDGWALYHDGGFDVSASVKAYYALKMIGDDPQAPHMARARAAILAAGGAAAVNVFTRIQLALFGAGPWDAVPTMPPELILAPRWLPVHLSKTSYWARTVVVPLLVLAALKPVARNARHVLVDELYTGRPAPLVGKGADLKRAWGAGFAALDRLLKLGEPLWPKGVRTRAIAACEAWVLERLNGVEGLGAIYPAMANSVMMFDALGYPPDHPARAAARESVERLLVVGTGEHGDEAYCQPCVSPVWDTALAAHAMMEAGDDAAADAGLAWLAPRQVLAVKGDWAEVKADVRPGGWAFQYANDHYPDLDDTAVVVMAMDRARGRIGPVHDEAVARGVEWTAGLQSRDGGFAAFDADNTHHYLNNLPFADHGALLDPPTADVTARVVSMLAQLGEGADSPRMAAALAYLAKEQEAEGSWFGRWGVNYIYGTWSVLCALGAAGLGREQASVARAVDWLVRIQNDDGGWGESCDSYDLERTGHCPAPSTASQTAWAVLGLMAVGEVASAAVARGIAWLQANQEADGLWGQEHYTGGGFPRVFYLRYHGYPKYFPLWAVARYRNLMRSNAGRPEWGM